MKKRILIVSFSEICKDPRVKRQISLLNNQYEVVVFGYGLPPSEHCKFICIPTGREGLLNKFYIRILMIIRAYKFVYWRNNSVRYFCENALKEKFDMIIANDLFSLPAAIKISSGRPIHADLHEFSPREFEERFLWRISFKGFYHYICKNYLKDVNSITTVCKRIADEYANFYDKNIEVMYNAPRYKEIVPSYTEKNQIRLVHHGVALRSRKLENMINLMEFLDERFFLTFMLVPSDPIYYNFLRSMSKNNNRIKFIDPVPTDKICETLSYYDVGVYLLEPTNFNNEFSLPNKFFEFIQARLCVAIGPSHEMKSLVERYNFGVVSEGFLPSSLGEKINSLKSTDVQFYKNNSDKAARQLCLEDASRKFLAIIDQHLSRREEFLMS